VYLLSVARLIACKDASLFEAFSCPWTPPLAFYKLLEIERLPFGHLEHDLHRPYASFPCRACQIFSGVRGVSIWRTPTWARASITALAMATGAASVGNSPIPFAPIGVRGDSVSSVSRVKVGVVLALGKG
jgi:hypothetical protein